MPDARTSRLIVDPDSHIGEVDPRVYGSFVEHMGRCVYDGIYDPEHPTADADGFRGDVIELVRELGPTILRYPGGNFVSGYDWEDGVGPKAERPRRLDLAWRSLETNQVGTDEFVRFCRTVHAAPMMATNLGTRGIDAARSLVEYCNVPAGSKWSDLRVSNGARDPHDIQVWCLGNEMDGPWQLGHKTAHEYGRLAAETAVAMRRIDPGIELVACGTSKPTMPTFASWEAMVLSQAYEHVDYLSMHMYVDPDIQPDRKTLLASSVDIDEYIESVISSVDYARAAGRHSKRMMLSFDEWNVWYNSRPRPMREWTPAPRLIEDVYTLTDALVVGSFLNSILRHADRIRMACLAQLVNVIAPIMTAPGGGKAWRQTTFYPFALTSRFGRGRSLRVGIATERYDTAHHEGVPVLDASAVWDEDINTLNVFIINRHEDRDVPLEIDVPGFPAFRGGALVRQVVVTGEPDAANTAAAPDTITPHAIPEAHAAGSPVAVTLPRLSWNLVRITPNRGTALG